MAANLDNPTVQRLLIAARTCFGRGGYHGTSLREIADEAQVSKALIHYHFDNKETLLLELEHHLYREIADEIRQVSVSRQPGRQCASEALDRLAESMLHVLHLVPVFVELSSVAMRREDLGVRVKGFLHQSERMIDAAIHETLGDDVAQLRISPSRLASLLLACLQGVAVGAGHAGEARTAQRMRDLKTMLLSGLFHAEAGEDGESE